MVDECVDGPSDVEDAVHGVLGCGACMGAGVGEKISLLCCDKWMEWELTVLDQVADSSVAAG